MFGVALIAIELALRRFQHALEDLATLGGFGVSDSHARYVKANEQI